MTLRLKYLFNRLRGARYYKHGSHDPTFRAYKSKHKRKLSCLSTDIYKWKRLRSLTIYQILPRAQDRSWGIKLNIEVQVELIVRLKSLCKKHKIGKREYKCTQQDLHQNYLHMHHYQQRGWWGLTAASQLWLGGWPKLWLQVTLLRWRTRVHIFTISIHHYGSAPVSLRERHP